MPRTPAICRLLAYDHEDRVGNAFSLALRELVIHDRRAVEGFLVEYHDVLGARVKTGGDEQTQNRVEDAKKRTAIIIIFIIVVDV